MATRNDISRRIKDQAASLGFMECSIVAAGFLEEESERFRLWLESGMHGKMNYMAANVEKRLNPELLFEKARSVIIVLQNYFPDKTQDNPDAPIISKYAYGRDYHYIIKNKLNKLLKFIREEAGACSGRAFTDSAPILERAWAQRAGLGWIGKNSNLISEKYGSFFFIGELILDIELPYDNVLPVRDHCGSCTRCIDACPAQAIVKPRVVDARKCISYQTIELKGEPDKNFKGQLENRVFGCDICQDVCPWNRNPMPHKEPALNPDPRLIKLTKKEWYSMDEKLFNEIFKNSAVERIGFRGIKNNLLFL